VSYFAHSHITTNAISDEIDAVFRKRSSAEDSGEATRSSVVNQILAKLDGVNAIPNVLMIGMTNRRELLDEALLRPGRLEVQIEIPLPDKVGRREIMLIHFEALRRKQRLSKPLCCAMDGVSTNYDYQEFSPNGVSEDNGIVSADGTQVKGRKRQAIRRAINQVVDGFPAAVRPVYDLAADYATGGFSGADIAGLVRCAGSIALSRSRNDGNGVEGLLITLEDVKQALTEVKR
jgi:SpoVK/Ycf46/Vps4 family AAA+-type ATPase